MNEKAVQSMFNSKVFDYVFLSLKGYKKSYLGRDLLAGVVVASLTIPVSMGYASIAGLPPIYGLYASVIPLIAYITLASSPQLNVGANASSSAITASVLTAMGISLGSPEALQLVPALSFFCAIFLLLFAIFKFGRFIKYISMPVMSGFISGVSLSIIMGQLPKVMDIKVDSSIFLGRARSIITNFGDTNWLSFTMGMATFIFIMVGKKKFKKFPVPLVMLLLSTLASYFWNFEGLGVSVVGEIPKGFSSFSFPAIFSFPNFGVALLGGFVIAVICFSDSLLASKSFSIRNKYKLSENRELAAYSLSNFSASFFGCAPVGASVSRTAASEDFKGKTQLVSLVSAVIVALVISFFSGVLYFMPQPVLSGIVIAALVSVVDVHVIKSLLSRSKKEAVIWIVSAAGVLLVGVLFGVLLGVILSFIDVISRVSMPPEAMLGVIEGENGYFDLERNKEAKPIPGVSIYRFSGTLIFANIQNFADGIKRAIQPDTKVLIIDASAIVYVDITAAEELVKIILLLNDSGIEYYFANGIGSFRDELEKIELDYPISRQHIKKTIGDALKASNITV